MNSGELNDELRKLNDERWKLSDERWKFNDERWKFNDEYREFNDERWELSDERWEFNDERREFNEVRWKFNLGIDSFASCLRSVVRVSKARDYPWPGLIFKGLWFVPYEMRKIRVSAAFRSRRNPEKQSDP